jgi:hypothetical protein
MWVVAGGGGTVVLFRGVSWCAVVVNKDKTLVKEKIGIVKNHT